jgi:hypothetical protein
MPDPSDTTPWQLHLDHGDHLTVHPNEAGDPEVVLTLSAWRAHDLATTLDRFNRLAAIFDETTGISTEPGLAQALTTAALHH